MLTSGWFCNNHYHNKRKVSTNIALKESFSVFFWVDNHRKAIKKNCFQLLYFHVYVCDNKWAVLEYACCVAQSCFVTKKAFHFHWFEWYMKLSRETSLSHESCVPYSDLLQHSTCSCLCLHTYLWKFWNLTKCLSRKKNICEGKETVFKKFIYRTNFERHCKMVMLQPWYPN